MTEPQPGQPCPVCGLPDPEHDWDVHDASPPPGPQGLPQDLPGLRTAGLPNMLLRSSTRGGQRVRVLALHTTEGIMRAADLRAWASWTGSSHASADETGALLGPAQGFVPYHLAAWTLRSGNPWSENIELCGMAGWTRAQWLARPQLLDATARWLAERHQAQPWIPLVKLTPQQYRNGAAGVIDHDDHTDGYQDGTHWDVGESFPWDVVIPLAQRYAQGEPDERDEPTTEAEMLTSVQLENLTTQPQTRSAVLAVDPVGESGVLPKGARAWLQVEAFCPPPLGQPATATPKGPRVDWLVAAGSKGAQPWQGFDLPARGGNKGVMELAQGTRRVEVRVTGIPAGGVVTVQVSATGRAQ